MNYFVKINRMTVGRFIFRAVAENYANDLWQDFYAADPEASFEGMVTINNLPLSYWNGSSDEEYFGVIFEK